MTNPGITTGGFFGESKFKIMELIPDAYKAKTVLLDASIRGHEIDAFMQRSGLTFPVIVKPEIGERGWLISRIDNLDDLKTYLHAHPVDFILQPFIELPLEVSIMVHKMPDDHSSAVTSICEKEFLHIRGDGVSTLEQLIISQDRAVLQLEKLVANLGELMHEVMPSGQYMLLEPIGNHCRGTKFINRNDQIDEAIRKVMTTLLASMPGVYYGRFDMKVGSWESLRAGKEICVLEFNGASSDPAHIFDPGYSIIKAYRDIYSHWSIMARIARQNRRAGMNPDTFKNLISALITYFRYKRTN